MPCVSSCSSVLTFFHPVGLGASLSIGLFWGGALPSAPLSDRNAPGPHQQDVRGHVVGHDDGCANYRARADLYTRHDRAAGTEPSTITDFDWGGALGLRPASGIGSIVRSGQEHDVLSDCNVVTDSNCVFELEIGASIEATVGSHAETSTDVPGAD